MKTTHRPEAVHPVRGLRRVARLARAGLVGAIAAARAWRWGAVFGRVALAGLGLVLLGAIGRSAFARNMLTTEAPAAADAGLTTPTSAPATSATGGPPMPAPSATAPAAAPTTETPTSTTASARSGRATPDDPVYLNQATLADLHRLPGVGPKRAEAILSLRTKLGHFHRIEDLMKVKGIGRSSMRKLRPLVRLDPPPAVGRDGGG